MPNLFEGETVVCGNIDVGIESMTLFCRNKEYGCIETVDYINNTSHEESCTYAPCSCPIVACNFIGSSGQLSLHFSSKHWDTGRRFKYNSPLTVSLPVSEDFVVLQAEEDGMLFLLNKGIVSIGHTVMITCIGPSTWKNKFLYDIISEKGISSLRLKSVAEYFPGRVEGLVPMDFLLIPYRFHDSSGELNLEVCIWNNNRNYSESAGCCS